MERISGGKGLVSNQVRCSITLSYDPLVQEGGEGGGALCWWRRTLAEMESKREAGADYEEIKQREDKHDKTKLTTIIFMHV